MPAYHFITHWRVQATAEEVAEVLGDAVGLKRWWPSVYLDVTELKPGDPKSHVGRVIDLYTKGWLPYTLKWQFVVVESDPPAGFKILASGDFIGAGEWTFKQDGDFVDVTYDWDIVVAKSLLVYGDLVFRPIFAANHRWAMARGEESLKLELLRRRARTDAERDAVAAPPGPTFFRRPRSNRAPNLR